MPNTSWGILLCSAVAFIYCLTKYKKIKNDGDDSCDYYWSLLPKIAWPAVAGITGLILSIFYTNSVLDTAAMYVVIILATILYTLWTHYEKNLPSELLLQKRMRKYYLQLLKLLEPFKRDVKIGILEKAQTYLNACSQEIKLLRNGDPEEQYLRFLQHGDKWCARGWAICFSLVTSNNSVMKPYLIEKLDQYAFDSDILPNVFLEVFKEKSPDLSKLYDRRMQ